jgi:endonuclease/exonuclease/phosphatase family metal-dependent hydrolase
VKITTYNIRYGLGLDQRYDLDRIADTVRDADIIGLQEVERFWKRSGMVDQPDILGQNLKEFYWVYCPAFDMDASQRQENGTVHNRRRQFGPMVLSRWPIIWSRSLALPKLGTVDSLNMDTGAIECVVDAPAGPIRVYCTHISAVSSRDRLMQIDQLLEIHRTAISRGAAWTGDGACADPIEAENFLRMNWNNSEPPPPMPTDTVLMGDFNSVAESPEYIRFAGEVDPAYGRVAHLDGFVDSWSAAQEKSGEATTWWPDPPDRSPRHGLRLDYCFLSPGIGRKVKRVWVDGAAEGSDHKPYWIELNL